MMRLRPVLCIFLAFCLLGVLYVAFDLYSPDGWTWSSRAITMRVMKMPVSAESTGAEWQVSISISLPNVFLTPTDEGWKEPPVSAKSMAAEWLDNIGTRLHNLLCGVRVKEDTAYVRKEVPISAESNAAEWPGSISLSNPQCWLRERMAIMNKDMEQPSNGTESTGSALRSCLSHLWEDLAQIYSTCLLESTCKIICLLYLGWINLQLFRVLSKPQGQVKYQDECHRKRRRWLKKGTVTVKARKDCKEKTEPRTGKKASASPEQSSESTSSCRSQAQQDFSCSLELPTISVCPQVSPCQGSRQTASSSSMAIECVSSNGDFSDCELLRQMEVSCIQLLRHLRNVERIRLKEHRQQYYKKKSCQ